MPSLPGGTFASRPRWSQCAVNTTASFLSCGSVPGSRPTTFALGVTLRSMGISNEVRTPRGAGWNDFCCAAARSLSRSRLASPASFFAPSSVTQPWNCIRCSLPGGRSMRVESAEADSTCQGYPAEAVVWITSAPAAPCAAAVRYL